MRNGVYSTKRSVRITRTNILTRTREIISNADIAWKFESRERRGKLSHVLCEYVLKRNSPSLSLSSRTCESRKRVCSR